MEFSFHGNMFKLGKMFLRRFSQIRDTNKRFEKHTLQLNESGHNTCRHELSVAADCDRLNFGSSTWLQDWEGLRVSTCDQHLHWRKGIIKNDKWMDFNFSWQYFWNWVSFVLKPFSQTCDSIELEPWGTLRAVRAHGEPWGTVCMLETVRVERTHVEPWGTVCMWGTVRVERTHVEPWGTVCMWGTVRVEENTCWTLRDPELRTWTRPQPTFQPQELFHGKTLQWIRRY